MDSRAAIEHDRDQAAPIRQFRSRLAWAPPIVFTLSWVAFVINQGHLERVRVQWRAAGTMVFGSFVAGSTPQGGGAVAFPVFTKVLEVPAAVARSFSLSIQASGMVMAALTIVIAGRKIDWGALRRGVVGGGIGFGFGAAALNDYSTPFADSVLNSAYVKVTFTIAIAALAYIVFLCFGQGANGTDTIAQWTSRSTIFLLGFTFVGGILSALTGSGVDVLLFFFVVVVAGLHPRVAVPTSIVAMAIVSAAGLVLFGIVDGQLIIGLDDMGAVSTVDGAPVGPLPATRFDLFGLWLAAAPIVVWGAPIGSWVASKMSSGQLITFVAAMALLEVATTVVFLDALHDDIALIAYFFFGTLAALFGVGLLGRHRHWILQTSQIHGAGSPGE